MGSRKIKPFLNLGVNIHPNFEVFVVATSLIYGPRCLKSRKETGPGRSTHTVLLYKPPAASGCCAGKAGFGYQSAVWPRWGECLLWRIMPRVTTQSCFATFLTSLSPNFSAITRRLIFFTQSNFQKKVIYHNSNRKIGNYILYTTQFLIENHLWKSVSFRWKERINISFRLKGQRK